LLASGELHDRAPRDPWQDRGAERTRDDPMVIADEESRRRTALGDEAVFDHPNLRRAHLGRCLFGEDLRKQRD
jgi:hypothetical protein